MWHLALLKNTKEKILLRKGKVLHERDNYFGILLQNLDKNSELLLRYKKTYWFSNKFLL